MEINAHSLGGAIKRRVASNVILLNKIVAAVGKNFIGNNFTCTRGEIIVIKEILSFVQCVARKFNDHKNG